MEKSTESTERYFIGYDDIPSLDEGYNPNKKKMISKKSRFCFICDTPNTQNSLFSRSTTDMYNNTKYWHC
jgi:hypothetical protein